MSIARRIAEHFVIPAGSRAPGTAGASAGRGRAAARRNRRADAPPAGVRAARACAVPPPRTPASLAVLAPARDAPALGGALALALARRRRSPVAVVCVWAPVAGAPPWRVLPLPAAARRAATLTARGHEARASGRLVFVRLAADCEVAAAEALRVSAAASPAPAVLALAGPRAAAFDALLAEQDLVVAAVAPGADPALTRLVLGGLERAVACDVPPARPARALAAAGVVLLPAVRRALAEPVAAIL